MCAHIASSLIESYYDKLNLTYKKKDNLTNDSVQWNQFLENIDKSEKLFRLHVMGGEPTISKKFLELVQKLVNADRTKLSLSFVSNGTILNTELIDLLKNFESVNIEISIESIDLNNDYIRQGSNVENVLENISWYRNNTNFQIVLRTVPQLLSVNTYAKFIRWAFDQNLSLQSIPLFYPECLQINVLPQYLKEKYKKDILDTMSYIESKMEHTFETISTGRDISRLPNQLIRECKTIAHLLSEPDLDNIHSLRNEMVNYLIRWDREFNFDARTFYPEYKEFFESHGYNL
jgi:sulfatase maturation enzyme AslB (radical SAM superfamily)